GQSPGGEAADKPARTARMRSRRCCISMSAVRDRADRSAVSRPPADACNLFYRTCLRRVEDAGVLLVFCYLILPSGGAMLYSEHIGTRLAVRGTLGALV